MERLSLGSRRRPLAGWRVALTRTTARSESLSARLRELGATPVSAPVIRHAPPEDAHLLDEAIRALCEGRFDWMVLTSANTAGVIAMGLAAHDCAWPARTRIAVVGEATARACKDALHRTPDCMPEQYDAASLAAAISAMRNAQNERVFLPNADIAQPALQTSLQAAGMQVDRVIAYRTVCNELSADVKSGLRQKPAHAVMFTSSSTVQCFAEQFEDRNAIAVCIGRQTAKAAESAGFAHVVTATTATEDDMVEALLRAAKQGKPDAS